MEAAKAGWKLRRGLKDEGSEVKGEFGETCGELSIRHTETKPRHARTDGFVERLQGTILLEHRRVVFRQQYFTRSHQLQTALDGFLQFHDPQWPHQSYCTGERTLAEISWGVTGLSRTKKA